jgi:hypothetical protein
MERPSSDGLFGASCYLYLSLILHHLFIHQSLKYGIDVYMKQLL